MRSLLLTAVAACGLVAFGAAVQAQTLVGSTVTGTLEFPLANPPTTNWYDPNNAVFDLVPSTGYDNSSSNSNSPTVTIDSNNEFGYYDALSLITANFTANTLTITDNVVAGGSTPWDQTFTDTAFLGAAFSEVSDSFGLSTASLTGDVITLDWAGASSNTGATDYSAEFSVIPASTPAPEPASMALLGTSLVALGALRRRRRA